MNWRSEWKVLLLIVAVFFGIYYLPIGIPRFDNSIQESLKLVKWYAREHVLLCLVPAFFIAGAIGVFVSSASVMKYLGAKANKVVAYGVASVSGTVLAVCSCTVLPLFAGIRNMGAGLGPAVAFLYSGPAINVLAIILTARILGFELGVARALGAIGFSIVIGLIMHFIYRNEEIVHAEAQAAMPEPEVERPLWQTVLYFAAMIGVLVFANWGKPAQETGLWYTIFASKWVIASVFGAALAVFLVLWFGVKLWKVLLGAVPVVVLAVLFPNNPVASFTAAALALSVITSTEKGSTKDWFDASWGFAKQILPLLLFGVLIAGALLGSEPGAEGLIPNTWVVWAVGGNSFWANLFASVAGAFMYFATLTEVPIVQGLMTSGMGKGPALALLLAGPALSLPSMLVIRSVIGTQKTIVYVVLVIIMATISGIIFGTFWG
ncbi:MAG: permease [Planctomycetes bacterium GWF2_50_10]|nr:MAG: permease [Planctomycetes bacterium GWF2_50_10]